MAKTNQRKEDEDNLVGYIIGGASLLGLGIGFFVDDIVAGVLIGAGAGMLAAASVIAKRRRNRGR